MTSLIVSSPLMASPAGGTHTIAGVGSLPCNPMSPQIQEIVHKLQQMQFQHDLNFKVVDDTALIDIPDPILAPNLPQQPKNAKKRPKRRGRKDWRKKKLVVDSSDKETTSVKYSRAEMLALSLENPEDQKKKWAAVYAGFPASVAAEYDGLVVASVGVWKNRALDFRRRPLLDKLDAAAAMGKRGPLKILVL